MCNADTELPIRFATAGDTDAITAVLLAAFEEYRPWYTADGFNATTPKSEQVRLRLAEGPIWVAYHEGILVGTVAAVTQPDSLYIRGMAVLPETRGLKLGERLLNSVQQYAVSERYPKLRLSTTPFLARAIRLYENFGFSFTDDGPADLFGTPLRTMEKQLPGW